MEENKVSVWKGVFSPGLLLGLILVLYSLLMYFTDQMFNKTLGYLVYLIYVAGAVLAIRSFRDKVRGGYLSYGGVVGAGAVIGLYTGIITGVYTYFLYAVIDPDLIAKTLEHTKQLLLDKGLSDEQVEMSIKGSTMFMKPWLMGLSAIVNSVFMLTVVSLIAGIFMKREPENPFAEEIPEEE
jgi:hypothetical protein